MDKRETSCPKTSSGPENVSISSRLGIHVDTLTIPHGGGQTDVVRVSHVARTPEQAPAQNVPTFFRLSKLDI